MFKKFFLCCFLLIMVFYGIYSFIIGGNCRDFILSRKEAAWAPGALYYLGNVYLIIQMPQRAEEVYGLVVKTYPKTVYCEEAYYRYFQIAAEGNRRDMALNRGEAFLERFPDSKNAEKIRKHMNFLKQF